MILMNHAEFQISASIEELRNMDVDEIGNEEDGQADSSPGIQSNTLLWRGWTSHFIRSVATKRGKKAHELEFGEHRLTILRGDRRSRQLHKYAPSMADAIKKCGVAFPNEMCMVTAESPLSYKDAVETFGACWLQELKYDFRPFTKWEYRKRDSDGRHFSFRHTPTTDDAARSFLWHDGKRGNFQMFGTCTFRLRADNFGHFWGLQWIWFHPAQRRKGHFTMAWPFLRSMFDVFVPEPPLSDEMIMFLRKMDYSTVLREYAKWRGREMPV